MDKIVPVLSKDEWDDIYLDCESNGEGIARALVRYAYEAGWKAAMDSIAKESD